jgi:DNA repair exonuclease SbcCD ATPase subunit
MFTRIETNFKGRPTNVALGKLNAIVGANRTGKTALLTAIKTACTPAPAAAQAQKFFGLAPSDADEAYARLYVDEEVVASFVVVCDNKGKAKAPKQVFGPGFPTVTPEQTKLLFPTMSLRDLLQQGDIKAREAIFRRFGELTGSVPEPFALDDESKCIWDKAVRESSQGKTDVSDVLSAVGEWLRSESRRISDEMRADEKQIKALMDQVRSAPGLDMLEAYREQLANASRYEAHRSTIQQIAELREALELLLAAREPFAARNEALAQQRTEHEQRTKDAAERIEGLRADVVQLEAAIAGLQERINRIGVFLYAADASDDCALCGHGHVTAERKQLLKQLAEERESSWRGLDKDRQALNSRIAAEEEVVRLSAHQLLTTEQTLRNEEYLLQSRIRNTEADIARLEAVVGHVLDYSGPTSEELQQLILPMEQAQFARQQLTQMETAYRGKRTRSALVKDLSEKSRDLLDTLVRDVRTRAEDAVNRYMPAGFRANLDLVDGGCSWCVTTSHGESDRFVMSGAEKASLMVALALAWTEDLPVRFLMLDDEELGPFHSSPENLAAMLSMVERAVAEGHVAAAYVAGIRKDEVPANWNMIERG